MGADRYELEIKKFGARVRELREEKGMSQFDLEAASGIDRADISRIENGRLDIKFSSIVKLADALVIDISFF